MARVYTLLGVILLSVMHFGCDNRALSATEPLSLYCEFQAYHMEDSSSGTTVSRDTAHVYVLGTTRRSSWASGSTARPCPSEGSVRP